MSARHVVACILALTTSASAATWPMKGRDPQNTGRADFAVPPDRANHTFFDIFLWQKRAPGSPGEGALSSTSMIFFDGAGPDGADIVVGGYHWPKGVQGMNRWTGALFWAGNPAGGESIGANTAALSNDGHTVYVTNDATQNTQFPQGHPLMAFATAIGPSIFRHNGANLDPGHLGAFSPRIAPDGRIFLHAWVDRPYAATDDGTTLTETWAAATSANAGLSDPVLYDDAGTLKVIIGSRSGAIHAYHGVSGAQLWSTAVGPMVDATPTIDPANGNIYVGAGSDHIYVVGLTIDGQPLWSSPALQVYDYVAEGSPQRAQASGCLSADGSRYYFQTNSQVGTGRLFAIDTSNGAVKWSVQTGSTGWEMPSSSPIVTTNGIVIVGSNLGGTYFAILDAGTHGEVLDTLTVADGGNARASATLSPEGILYLPLRAVQTVGTADENATQTVQNLFTAIDLRSGASAILFPPADQVAVAGNNSVTVSWRPITDPASQFDHYAIYRATTPFTSVAGMTPIAAVADINASSYVDHTALNGTAYYYAVTSVSKNGGEIKEVTSVGPRTPHDETDLQVVCIARTPRYPRYAPNYTSYTITEPSGFGPYIFTAATSLGHGQTGDTPRWPDLGQPVTYTATVRNRGTNTWNAAIPVTWHLDGIPVASGSPTVLLAPGDTATFAWMLNWDGLSHDIHFAIGISDERADSNTLLMNTRSVGFLTYIDQTNYQNFRENSSAYPQSATDDLIDWLNRHMARFNAMFAAAGSQKRVHYDVLQLLADTAPDPTSPDTIYFAIFPFRYNATDNDQRLSGFYNAADDIDYGLLHEMGHQLGLIDLYRLNLSPEANLVSGLGYSTIADLMHGCSPFLSPHSAGAMNLWLDRAHGYYGQYLYSLPTQIRLRLLGTDGEPLSGAVVQMYQKCERPGLGEVITNQIKAQGVTDANGEWLLPNVPIDPTIVPPAFNGDILRDNPFGYVAVVGTNGLLHFRVEYNTGIDYCWLDITECNVACWQGQTETATFTRQLSLGGPVQYFPPADLTELNADDWSSWAQGSDSTHTFVQDDTSRKEVGDGSLRFVTDGGFDTYVRYPRTFTALWNLSGVETLNVRFYAENPNAGFQSGSPWIKLLDAEGNSFQYQYYSGGGVANILNEARNQWKAFEIPLYAGPDVNDGWRRTAFGTPDLSRIQYIEIHADTWDYGFTLWIDGLSFTPQPVAVDMNHDGHVDSADLELFEACRTGPALGPPDPACRLVDFDRDQDIDQSDFGVFQRCLTGSSLNNIAGCEGL